VPIKGYHFANDSIYVDEYIGDEDKPEKKAYSIVEVITGKKTSDLVKFHSEFGPVLVNAKQLADKIVTEQIIKRTFWLGTDTYGRRSAESADTGCAGIISGGFYVGNHQFAIGDYCRRRGGLLWGMDRCLLELAHEYIMGTARLLLVIAISFALGKGLWEVFIAVRPVYVG